MNTTENGAYNYSGTTFTAGDGSKIAADYSAYQYNPEPWWHWLATLAITVLVLRWLWPKTFGG